MIPGSNSDHPDFKRSVLIALQGFRIALTTERNIKYMAALALVYAVLGAILRFDLISWSIFLLACGSVFSAELLNTAIETVVDLVSPEFHPLAGRAKDIAAGAVWLLSALMGLVGILLIVRQLVG